MKITILSEFSLLNKIGVIIKISIEKKNNLVKLIGRITGIINGIHYRYLFTYLFLKEEEFIVHSYRYI